MDKHVEISVIVPVYNVERYLSECLDSVLKQVEVEFEVICVNDGSTDSSLDILKKYANQDSRVKVFTKVNGGLSDARNFGIEKANGEYIYFLDSDDMIKDQTALSFMVKEMQENDLDILYFDGVSIFETEDLHQKHKFFKYAYERKKEYGLYEYGQELFEELVNQEDYFVNAALQCLKRKFIEDNRLAFPVGLLYEDNVFKFESLLMAGRVKHIKKTVYIHRVRENSITTEEKTFEHFYSYWNVCKRMRYFVKKNEKGIKCLNHTEQILKEMEGNVVYEFYGLSQMQKKLDGLSEEEKKEVIAFIDEYERNRERDMIVSKISDAKLEEIKNSGSKLIVYGAGSVGSVCVEYLLSQNINVEAVAVTSTDENPVDLWGKRIYSIDEIIDKYENHIILICVMEKKQKAIQDILIQKGLNKESVFTMSDSLYQEWQVFNSKNISLNKEMSYYKRYIRPYVQTLNKICRERKLDKGEVRKFIAKETELLESHDICLARLVVVLSTKCSLRCKDCNNLIPHFKPQEDLDTRQIIESLEIVTDSVGKLLKCELIGGEPFLAKNLEMVLEYVIGNKKIESVEITTNGTIMPRTSLLKLLQNPKVLIRISDYGTLVDKSNLIEFLNENKILYEILETGKWVSPGGIEKRNRDIETLMQEYARCSPGYICKTLYKDKIFACARAASLYALGYMKEPEAVHLNENFKPEYLKKFILREFSIACDYCDMAVEKKCYVEPAKQI